jgi:signal transduction histidine kinase
MRKPYDVATRLALAQVVLMVAVIGAFVADSVVDLRESNAATRDVGDITGDVMPSIEYLARARGELHALDEALARAVRTGATATIAADVGGKRQAIDVALASYLALPLFPGERALYSEVADAKADFDRTVAQTIASLKTQDSAAVQSSREAEAQASQRLDAALERLAVFNAEQGARVGHHLVAGQERIQTRALLFDGVLAILALGATALAAVIWRRSVLAMEARSAELDAFAGRVAHDVLSPLMAVSMGLSLSKMRLAGDEAATVTLERASRALERVRVLVSGLLEFAQSGAGPASQKTTEVCATIRSVLDYVDSEAVAAGVEVQLEPSKERRVACAPGILTSLVQNLVRNAIKHMGDAPRRHVTVRTRDAGAFVHVEVEDTGPGVPEAIRTKLFQPFVRGTDAVPGAGLGLATVKRLAERHGGRVGYESTPGSGSLFWFELPCAPPEPVERSHPTGPAAVPAPTGGAP